MAETTKVAREVQLTLEVLLGGGYKAEDRLHGVHTCGRTDADALRRLHVWLEQRGLADPTTVYQITRSGRPASVRDVRDYSLTGREILAGLGSRPSAARSTP
jgi:hypothetical protein